MPRGGPRPNTGPKKKKVQVPVELLSPSVAQALGASPSPTSPTPPAVDLISEEQILAKLNELALEGNPIALRLFIEQRERAAKVELLKEQTKNLRLRNQVLKHHLEREGLPEEDEGEYEPNEDPVQQREPALKIVSK